MSRSNLVKQLNEELSSLELEGRLALIASRFKAPVFTTSMGLEDQVLTWASAVHGDQIKVVTLQTGRLFPETNALITVTEERYGISIIEYRPDKAAVDEYIASFGENGFYDSLGARKQCCAIRKVAPLGRALKGADAWITGLRREQSESRQNVPFADWDDENKLVKFNPLADWTSARIADAVLRHKIPTNPLHARNYPSIGCEPCTRAVKPGEPERAGRWWWENSQHQECGLHVAGLPASKEAADV